jgi:lantibiotic modifying enzyme
MLYDPQRHEPLTDTGWDADAARSAVAAIARDALASFSAERLWPTHRLDRDDDDRQPFTMLYFGAAGVIWALDRLAHAGVAEARHDFAPLLDDLVARNVAQVEPWGHGVESLLMGRAGTLLLHYRLAPSPATADRLAASIAANTNHPSLEMLWGASGTMHAALAMHERTGEARWADLFRDGARALAASFAHVPDAGCRLWTQDLYGRKERYIGAGHGFAGNAGALVRGRALLSPEGWAQWADGIAETTQATALRDGAQANWPAALVPSGAAPRMLVQWCHGAPGIVTSLADLPDARLDAPLIAAGELVWAAGPLTKGPGLCHGTAGNGYAFLKLYRRTGDGVWLDRARRFAMHALAQSLRHAGEYGMRRYSLWTGDLGLALYLWDCLTGGDRLPSLDRGDGA